MTWMYVSIDEANQIMRRHSPFDDVRTASQFPGRTAWEDILRLANNAIMCAHEHKDHEQQPLDGDTMNKPEWRKSSYSGSVGCVETATVNNQIWVRDSKHPDGPTLKFTRHEWQAFIAGVHNNEFNA